MDSRGPPEGAPAESFEISCIDKGADISVNWPTDHAFASSMCEQPKKLNNRLLFLTVSNFLRLTLNWQRTTMRGQRDEYLYETFLSSGGICGGSEPFVSRVWAHLLLSETTFSPVWIRASGQSTGSKYELSCQIFSHACSAASFPLPESRCCAPRSFLSLDISARTKHQDEHQLRDPVGSSDWRSDCTSNRHNHRLCWQWEWGGIGVRQRTDFNAG